MKQINYFFQFIIIIILFSIFKIIGSKLSSTLGGKIFEIIGPLFRSKIISERNLSTAFPELNEIQKKNNQKL